MTEILRNRDFTKKKKQQPVSFTLDGDKFNCVRKMSFDITKQVSKLKDATTTEDRLNLLIEMVNSFLLDESAKLFEERLKSKTNPIDVEEVGEIAEWLVEVYTGRPLAQPELSVNGSSTDSIVNVGTSSTDGPQAEMSIPVNSPPTVF